MFLVLLLRLEYVVYNAWIHDCRLALVKGLKWVDEVIPNAPYAITEKFMSSLFNEHKIDYIIHGDDPCLLPDGSDAYALAKRAGRYKQIKRTEGVSSTDIVGNSVIIFRLPPLFFSLIMGVMLCEPPLMVKGVVVGQMCHNEYLKVNVSLPVDQCSMLLF